MQPSRTEINKEFQNPNIDFTIEWDILKKNKPVEKELKECPQCGFLSNKNPCIFCGSQCEAVDYENNNVFIVEKKRGADNLKEVQNTIVYCIDISGSMQGQRIDFVKTRINEELDKIIKDHPEEKVCLITFESDCHIIGDGSGQEIEVGCEFSYERIEEIAKTIELKPLKESIDNLRDKIKKIECIGRTASISALALATNIAAKTGGEVHFYTDGMRNKGLPAAQNTERIINCAKANKDVFIHIFFFANCQAFIAEYSVCSEKTGGAINPIYLTKNKREAAAAIKREIVAHNVKIHTIMQDDIIDVRGKGHIEEKEKVANNENFMVTFNVTQNSPARRRVNDEIYAQTKVEYVNSKGSLLCAYVIGKVKIVNTVDKEDTAQVISNQLNRIVEYIEQEKYEDAKVVLKDLSETDFRIGADSGNFYKNAFTELMSYLEHVGRGDAKKDDIVSLLNYMKNARKDGIKV